MPDTHRETMTSRQRVMCALEHKQPDRMPIDLGIHFASGISAFAYHNLREYLGLSTDQIEIPDMVQFLARVDEDILKRFHIDTMLLCPPFAKTQRWNPSGEYHFSIPATAEPVQNGGGDWFVDRGGRMRMPKGGFFFDGDWLNFEDRGGDEVLDLTAKRAEWIFKETDYYTAYCQFHAFFNGADMDFLCRMLTDPETVAEENQRYLDDELAEAGKVIDKMGGYIQCIQLNSDLGTQRSPLCSIPVYEELCAPYLAKLCEFIHQNSDCKTMLHCCGSIQPYIPVLIQAGIDIINPVQISADNMDARELKQKYGNNITFWGGGCNTQQILSGGTPDEVKQNVKELTDTFKPNGGFVFNQVHNIMGNVPPENIVTMLDTAYENSFY